MQTSRGLPLLLLALLGSSLAHANVAPVIDSLTASTTAVTPEGTVFLQVDGHRSRKVVINRLALGIMGSIVDGVHQ